MDRRNRSLAWTIGVFAVLAGPISFRIWLDTEAGRVAAPRLGTVEPFVYRDTEDKPLTKDGLVQGVVVVVNIPSTCDSCDVALRQASETAAWIHANLVIGYTEEKNPLHLLSTGGGYVPQEPGWRTIKELPRAGELIPEGYDPTKPWLVVIDPWMVFAGAWDLSQPIDQKNLERVLSRTTFEQYLGNYLARRTFMGPRRDL